MDEELLYEAIVRAKKEYGEDIFQKQMPGQFIRKKDGEKEYLIYSPGYISSEG